MTDEIGDRMKLYEGIEAERVFCPRLPIIVRLDGRAFHSWTRDLQRPFDPGFVELMRRTTQSLIAETQSRIGYTQSDEISLVLWQDDPRTQPYFGGRVQKIVSVLAAHATATFNSLVPELVPSRIGQLGVFDCRAWVVPNTEEAANTLLWREMDATRNSLSMLARGHYSHDECENRDSSQLHEMLHRIGINWAHLEPRFKRGSWFQRRTVQKALSPDALERIPAQYRPTGPIERQEIVEIEMPPFGRVTNRVAVIFENADPQTASAEAG